MNNKVGLENTYLNICALLNWEVDPTRVSSLEITELIDGIATGLIVLKAGVDPIPKQIPETADAQIWAKEFVQIVKENSAIALDEETMIAWFSNSIMAGYDFAKRKYSSNATDTSKDSEWHLINNRICPSCNQTNMLTVARGGTAENRWCNGCGSRYWLVPGLPEAGSQKIE